MPGESPRSEEPAGYSSQGHKESDKTKKTQHACSQWKSKKCQKMQQLKLYSKRFLHIIPVEVLVDPSYLVVLFRNTNIIFHSPFFAEIHWEHLNVVKITSIHKLLKSKIKFMSFIEVLITKRKFLPSVWWRFLFYKIRFES